MMEGPIPQNYDEWHHCITVECGIPLTPTFIDKRIAAMQDTNDFKTKQFIQLYGAQYHQRVLAWFHQAKEQVEA
ncbi:hypothetical protein [Alkalimarinus coralli]|uniref:hypothetical protein n=1 Tax=Alkalimarinus coralli TaxID=2935863 RepID=UPI00202B98F6|nr:hypothetical protein [Alkalimarinus coralli]